ncbi:MAG: STAS domain-containing protein [Rhodospirillales bacterium]
MKHAITEEGDLAVVALEGEIDLEFSRRVRDVLLEAVGNYRGVVVDLTGVSMVDSSGVASMLEAFQTARKRGKGFILAAANENVTKVLRLARLDTVFELADDVEAAKQALA